MSNEQSSYELYFISFEKFLGKIDGIEYKSGHWKKVMKFFIKFNLSFFTEQQGCRNIRPIEKSNAYNYLFKDSEEVFEYYISMSDGDRIFFEKDDARKILYIIDIKSGHLEYKKNFK